MNECDIFIAALAIESAEERDIYLDEACGKDTPLRQRVAKLLDSHGKSGSLLEHPAIGAGATQSLADTGKMAQPASGEVGGDVRLDQLPLDFLEPSDEPGSLGRLAQYEMHEVVGRGGMGIVLRACDTKLSRTVAVKVLAPELAANATARKRFLREARSAAAVSHDHVVTTYAVEENEPPKGSPRAGRPSLPYLVMEFIDGQSLEQKLDRQGHLELKEILRIGRQVAAGLAAAHAQGLIHRDIKPSNILLQNSIERVKITDFGLARAVDDACITRTGEVAGTPQYMSPEQAQGHPVDARSDLFSLGSVLYAMCTGRSPFRAETTMASLRRVCDDTPRPIREINPDIPEWLAGIIDRLLEKGPADRFQSAEEVCQLLGRCLAHVQDPAAHPLPASLAAAGVTERKTSFTGFAAWVRPSRRWATAAAVLVAVFALVTLSEATGVTNLASTVIRIATGEGTLVIEIDDPTVQVSLDGEALSIAGAGIQELKLRPGQYQFQAMKDGESVKTELVSISRGGKEVVRVMGESGSAGLRHAPTGNAATDYRSFPEGAITQVRRLGHPDDHRKKTWVCNLVFTPTGQELLCGRASQSLEIWNLNTGTCSVTPETGETLAISPKGDLVATGHYDTGLVSVWDLNRLRKVRELPGHSSVNHVCFSPDQRHLLSSGGRGDNTARIWDLNSGNEIRRFDRGDYSFIAEFSPDGEKTLIGGGDFLRLYDMKSGEEVWHIGEQGFSVAKFSPCGRWLITAAYGRPALQLRDAATGEKRAEFAGHAGPVRSLEFLPDGRHFLSGSEDRTILLWDVETGRKVARVTSDNHVTNEVAVSPDGRYAASGGGRFKSEGQFETDSDYAIRLWRLPESVWPQEAATAENDAFVILGTDGAEVGKFDTLADAVLGSSAGDTIEIRGNGPFIADDILIRHSLIIRAASGFRPVIRRRPKKDSSSEWLLMAKSRLVLEGLELQSPAIEGNLLTSEAPLYVANCRFLTESTYYSVHNSENHLSFLRNSEFITSQATNVAWEPSTHGHFAVENCLLVGPFSIFRSQETDASLRLNHNTILNRYWGPLLFTICPPRDAQQVDARSKAVRVAASGNIFAMRNGIFLHFNLAPKLEPFNNRTEAEALLARLFRWREEENLYDSVDEFLKIKDDYLKKVVEAKPVKDLAGWSHFWDLEGTGSTEGIIRFQGGDLHAKSQDQPQQLTPEDFRLRPDSAGYRAGPDGKDLGADVDLVGPGEAYERWKKTPEYAAWREEVARWMAGGAAKPENDPVPAAEAKPQEEQTTAEK